MCYIYRILLIRITAAANGGRRQGAIIIVEFQLLTDIAQLPVSGSLFNAGAIVVGGALGLIAGRFIPERTHQVVFQCFGLFCLYLGMDMALKTKSVMIVMTSLILGALTGEFLDLESRLAAFGEAVRRRVRMGGESFTRGFVTTTLLFCVGSMAILGALEEGLGGRPDLLLMKGVMDGTASILFAASMGVGVLFSSVPLLIYEGTITLLAGGAQTFITPEMIDNLTGTGGLMILAIGLGLLKITDVRVGNLLPGLFFSALLSAVF